MEMGITQECVGMADGNTTLYKGCVYSTGVAAVSLFHDDVTEVILW